MTRLRGVFPVLPTPFDGSGQIDPAALARLVEFAIEAGADGVVYPGMASEVETLTPSERLTMVEALGRALGGRLPFIVGASAADPAAAAARAEEGRLQGAKAAMIMAPAAAGTDPAAQIAFFQAVAAATNLPIMLQNAPQPMGAGLAPETVAAIAAAVPQIRYVKEETLPCGQNLTRILAASAGRLDGVFGGAGARYLMDEVARGAAGTMPAAELTDVHVAIMRAHAAGAAGEARRLYSRTLPLLLFQQTFRVRMTKAVLAARGLIVSTAARAAGRSSTPGMSANSQSSSRRRKTSSAFIRPPAGGRRMPLDAITKVETFIVSIPRDVPYLGPLKEGESINAKGYLIRKGNRSIYPSTDMSVLVKVTGESGKVGWGETYGIVAPQAVKAIIDEVLGPAIIGRDPSDPVVIHEDLYDLMRVRGFFGGYYVDSLAGVDIAIWDLFGKGVGLPLASLVGGKRHATLPAYVSGLPKATLQERCDLAVAWVGKGYRAIKFAAAVAEKDIVREMAALREAVGPDIHLMVDLHWKFTSGEAVRLIRQLEQHDLYFAEAPCEPEDIDGQEIVAAASAARWRSARNGARPSNTAPVSRSAACRSSSPRWATPASRNSCRSAAWRMPSTSTRSLTPRSASASSWRRACRRRQA